MENRRTSPAFDAGRMMRELSEPPIVFSFTPDTYTTAEPCMMQSAFRFKNGIRFLTATTGLTVRSFECDENWMPIKKIGEFEIDGRSELYKTATQWHQYVRKLHHTEKLIIEQSTDIKSKS